MASILSWPQSTTVQQVKCTYHIWLMTVNYSNYPTQAREFEGFRVWGKFVFRTLELTDTPTNLANQVKEGHALDQSRSVQSHGPERTHQINEPPWRSLRTDRRLSRQFWDDWLAVFTFQVWDKNKNPFWMASLTLIFTRSVELRTHLALRPRGLQSANWPREDQCQRCHAHGFFYYYSNTTSHWHIFQITERKCSWMK